MKRSLFFIPIALILTGASSPAAAFSLELGPHLDEQTLAAQRGGFVGPGGIRIDFSLHHIVNIDGEQIVSAYIGPGLQGLSQGGGSLPPGLADSLGESPLASVTDGGTTVVTTATNTIIQNTADGRVLESVKMLNIQLSNLKHLGSFGLQSRIERGIVDTLR